MLKALVRNKNCYSTNLVAICCSLLRFALLSLRHRRRSPVGGVGGRVVLVVVRRLASGHTNVCCGFRALWTEEPLIGQDEGILC